jgi:hemoglobin
MTDQELFGIIVAFAGIKPKVKKRAAKGFIGSLSSTANGDWRRNVMNRRWIGSLLAIALLVATLGSTRPAAAQNKDSLYKRLGGYDAIAAVTDDFIKGLATDPKISRFFVGASDNSKDRIRQLVKDQLCAATGGPCVYIGRDMKTVHKGLHITEEDWNSSVKILMNTLNKFKVKEREQKDVVTALSGLHDDIVEK